MASLLDSHEDDGTSPSLPRPRKISPPRQPGVTTSTRKVPKARTALDWALLEMLGMQSDKRNVVIGYEERARQALYERFSEVRKDCLRRERELMLEEMARREKHLRLIAGTARALRHCAKDQTKARIVIEATELFSWHEYMSIEEKARSRFVLLKRAKREKLAKIEQAMSPSMLRESNDPQELSRQRRQMTAEIQRAMDIMGSASADPPSTTSAARLKVCVFQHNRCGR